MRKVIYPSLFQALSAFGRLALPLTEIDGRERCAALYALPDGTWKMGHLFTGTHNNVIFPTLLLALGSLFTAPVELAHTHPLCPCHDGEHFSGCLRSPGRTPVLGDATVPGLFRIRAICLATPSGRFLRMDRSGKIEFLGILKSEAGTPLCQTKRHKSRFFGQIPVNFDKAKTRAKRSDGKLF